MTLGRHYSNLIPLGPNHEYNREYIFFLALFKNATTWLRDLKRYIRHLHKNCSSEISTVSHTRYHPLCKLGHNIITGGEPVAIKIATFFILKSSKNYHKRKLSFWNRDTIESYHYATVTFIFYLFCCFLINSMKYYKHMQWQRLINVLNIVTRLVYFKSQGDKEKRVHPQWIIVHEPEPENLAFTTTCGGRGWAQIPTIFALISQKKCELGLQQLGHPFQGIKETVNKQCRRGAPLVRLPVTDGHAWLIDWLTDWLTNFTVVSLFQRSIHIILSNITCTTFVLPLMVHIVFYSGSVFWHNFLWCMPRDQLKAVMKLTIFSHFLLQVRPERSYCGAWKT